MGCYYKKIDNKWVYFIFYFQNVVNLIPSVEYNYFFCKRPHHIGYEKKREEPTDTPTMVCSMS